MSSDSSTGTYCATVASGATGATVLATRARALGRPLPRYENGLLCAIDGYPVTGCGEPDPNGGYRYWSYWHRAPGSSSWSYSTEGATSFVVADGSVEGWSFQTGGSEANRPPPSVSYVAACPPAATAPPKPASSSPVPAGPAPSPEAARPAATPPRSAAVTPPRSAQVTGRPSRAVTSVPASASSASSASSPVLPSDTTAEPVTGSPSLTPAATNGDDIGGLPLGPVAGVALISGIAVATALRARRG